ncbi:hypothetical protein [Streptomyces sp. ERV7]|uniref:hypothetical protein n=1 Tax=Streptomyces sp. ERV7 TaxID=1322334 RepID=UPI000B0A8E3A|nr:hypothetical protein [Streptomyces sp. ERV7]
MDRVDSADSMDIEIDADLVRSLLRAQEAPANPVRGVPLAPFAPHLDRAYGPLPFGSGP